MKTTTIIGILLFLLALVGSIVAGSNWSSFIHIPSIVFLIPVAGGLTLIRYRKGDGIKKFFQESKRYVIISGILGCVVGLIQMGNALTDFEHFLPGLAVALLTVFYAIILHCLIDTFA